MNHAALAALVVCFAFPASEAHAQGIDRPIKRLEIEAGGGWLSGAALGSSDAGLVANDPTRREFVLFSTDSQFKGALQLQTRAAFAFSRRVSVEGGLVWSRPDLETTISGDVEGGIESTVSEQVNQYLFEGGLLIMLDSLRFGERTVPYVGAGGGYLRQLHEGRLAVEEGGLFYTGGGLKHWMLVRDDGWLRAAGLRADARLYLLISGISVEGGVRPHAALSGSVFFTF